LHLVGILFPHINDDAWSKSHQIGTFVRLWDRSKFCHGQNNAWRQRGCM